VVFGVLSVVVGVLTFFDVPHYKWFVSLQGLLLIGWLSAEVFYGLFEPNLHIPFYFIGFFLLVIGVLLKLRKRTFI
jgi:hypothetical protein